MNLKLKSVLAALALTIALTGTANAQIPTPLTATVDCTSGQAIVLWEFASERPAYINVWINETLISWQVSTPANGGWRAEQVSVDVTVRVTPFFLEQELPSYETHVTGSCATTAVSIRTLSATSRPWWAFWR